MGLILMGEAVLSKSLILFSVDWWSCVPSLLFNLGPNYGGGNEYNGTSFKRSHAGTATGSAPKPAAGHCRLTPLPDAHLVKYNYFTFSDFESAFISVILHGPHNNVSSVMFSIFYMRKQTQGNF